ncbi:hypothetical protein ACJJTC_004591 [Scirpophaga incertulas]
MMENHTIDNEAKLSRASNWATWKFKVKVLLRAAGVFDVVDGSCPCPVKDKDDLEKWNKLDAKAQDDLTLEGNQKDKEDSEELHSFYEDKEELLDESNLDSNFTQCGADQEIIHKESVCDSLVKICQDKKEESLQDKNNENILQRPVREKKTPGNGALRRRFNSDGGGDTYKATMHRR